MLRYASSLILTLALGLSAPAMLPAQPGGTQSLGIGARLGTPTGFSLKYWFNKENAIDVAVGTHGYYGNRFYPEVNTHIDYLWHSYGVFGPTDSQAYRNMPLYFGVGGVFATPDVTGVRAVAGITWLFEEAPFDLFIDAAPTLIVSPWPGFGMTVGTGARFYF